MHKLDKKILLTCGLMALVHLIKAQELDTTHAADIQVSVSLEFNYGHHYQDGHSTLTDLPHITVGADINLHRGWTITAEMEYEQFKENDEWQGTFAENYATNKFYINKQWRESFNLKTGIIDIPVGLTNAGGPALTIYDPVSESAILPMTWHSFGVALWGNVNRWRYEVGVYGQLQCPISKSTFSGMAVRLDYRLMNHLNLGLSSYLGQDQSIHAAFDFAYDAHGWMIDGQYIYSNSARMHSFGTEIGYNLLSSVHPENDKQMILLPFVRIDRVYQGSSLSSRKYSCGIHLSPFRGCLIKIGYGVLHESCATTCRMLDFSAGFSF